MRKIFYLVIISTLLIFTSCDSKMILPNASGAVFEVLVVVDDSVWKAPEGKEVFELINADMLDVPQKEPMFKMSRVNHAEFDNLLRPARNILIVDVAPRYTQPKISFAHDRWARRQAVVTLTMPSKKGITELLEKNGEKIQNFFIKSERKTYQDYLKSSHNSQMESEAFKRFGIQILIPFEMTNYNYGENFMWISNGGVKARQDLVIYSYPYTDVKNLELNNLIHKRDSILKANIPGPDEGSYMGTELVYHTPSLNEIAINNAYCAEVHGLWKVMNGGLMGGPFVSHTRIDEINNRVITIEGFVFAPERDKRNYIRQLEAILYTVRMPQEVNEVIVKKKK
ncbi:MAG: DUF4837 family protein [Paludibacteraceae bacterium]|nr:DUF4837 family protein [Paludibacteraceae bacterium]